ncbi:MAG: hypothetical protein KGJ59_02285 [Bacteroidota bacterium]|nr:hypothetical protein [Bacteroidota bacterium]
MTTQPISASLWTYLWDFVDEGYDTVFNRVRESRIDSVSVATAYHTGKFLLPHNPRRAVIFPEDGTVYFQPNEKLYGKIHPRVNSLVKSGNSLRTVKAAGDKHGIRTRAWIVCCHNTMLGMTYPGIACETAFGDKLFHNLCPAHEDVRKYIAALVADVASTGIDRIELEAFQFQGYVHGFHHEREGIVLSSAARFLLGLCFCPSCIASAKRAGVEIEKIRSWTKTALQNFFNSPDRPEEEQVSLSLLPQDLFSRFFQWRASVVNSFAEEIMNAVKATQVKIRPIVSIDSASWKIAGTDLAALAEITGGVLALGYVKEGAVLRPLLEKTVSEVSGKEIILGVHLGVPESGGKKEFFERMSAAHECGIRAFNFYNYSFVPYENLKWIGEALLK